MKPDEKPDPRRNLVAPWDAETAAEAGRRSGIVRKGKPWTWEGRTRRLLRKRAATGERVHDQIIAALVQKALEGDPRAIELCAKLGGWKPESKRTHEHTVARDLLIRPDGDTRGRVLPATPIAVPALPEASSKSPVSDNGHSVARSEPPSAVRDGAGNVEREGPAQGQAAQ